ncbi:hypothetical protein [Brucella pseudogrignonensis]|uniref:hypothetical protein n=1 Tax=Brucella pseudogrignonensis TaxID=419475 RepID=UPI003ECC4CEC
MEHLVAIVDKFLTGSPRTGWLLFIFGTAMISLGRFEVLPAPEIIPGWQTLFWGCLALGATMLLTSFGAWIVGKIKLIRQEIYRDKENEARIVRMDEAGYSNVALLPHWELEALLYILRNEKKRFIDADFRWSRADLINRHIVYRDRSSNADDVFVVNDLVWERRAEILASNHRNIPTFKPW